MPASIVADDKTQAAKTGLLPPFHRKTILFWGALVALLAIAIGTRLYGLGVPFDRDGYDEGVYWQTLISMHAGHSLYQQIFYSQPPFFMLSTYPFYALFGSTLWSARLGIALVSLLGLAGAFCMGKAMSGRLGAIAAVFLLVIDPLYLSQSQRIEAEVSSAAFSLLAVGAAYLWWEVATRPGTRPHPWATQGSPPHTHSAPAPTGDGGGEDRMGAEGGGGAGGVAMAGIAGVALSLGIMCKLLSVSSIVPIALLLLARLWQVWQKDRGFSLRELRSILLLVAASVGTLLVILVPFAGAYSSMIRDVITFHTDARTVLINNQVHNLGMLKSYLHSNLLLVIAACIGLVSALLRRDWRFIPLAAWILVTTYMLLSVVPLFYRHFLALDAPLIAMAVMGVGRTLPASSLLTRFKLPQIMPALAALIMLTVVVTELPPYPSYYQYADKQGRNAEVGQQGQVVNDLRSAITADQLVVTDDQFAAARAGRRTPASLVDTSMVRIASGYLTQQQLENAASQPQVHAVLFFTNRLRLPQVAGFYSWVKEHFHLKYRYGPGQELWIR